MKDTFISSISVNNYFNLKNLDLNLGIDNRRHLIITGKNGSGKTLLVRGIRDCLKTYISKPLPKHLRDNQYLQRIKGILSDSEQSSKLSYGTKTQWESELSTYERWFDSGIQNGTLKIAFNSAIDFSNAVDQKFIATFFEASRHNDFSIPSGISREISPSYLAASQFDNQFAKTFIQYLVNLKAERAFLNVENQHEAISKIDTWFKNLEVSLSTLFDSNLKLEFKREEWNFYIVEENKRPYTFNQLSAGYSAVLSILTEILLRVGTLQLKTYEDQGVVIIDEIETHLHVDLQKKILPFLTTFFPKIQFIVTTHSPFVLSSITNSVICDLEKNIITSNLSGYSYDTLIESYFGSDNYSLILQERISEYEHLVDNLPDLNEEEQERLLHLKRYMNDIPKFSADELAVKIRQIQFKELEKRHTK